MKGKKGFGTAPVFFTAISTILGAILFLRFGYAVGTLGFWGIIAIILIGHMVTIPTAFAISEIATNQRVEGGGEYYIISRSFGLNVGGTIGITLYLSQAISVAFYVIAFTESFAPLFEWFKEIRGVELPRQVVSLPAMAILAVLILKKGANVGVTALYVVAGILFISLILFFAGHTEYANFNEISFLEGQFRNSSDFFKVFAIIFPAFTGMTAGVGLSGDLKEPGKSIPRGTIIATLSGFIIYIFIAYKLITSASPTDLINNQLIMADIAVWGSIAIPLGLAASTISSALGSIMVAPRTLQALGADDSFPFKNFNKFISRSKKSNNEPVAASFVTIIIAFIFVAIGDINAVATVITMFFMVTYGTLCLISFMNHFGSSPSYRPEFKSHPALSFIGFVFSLFLMLQIDTLYTIISLLVISGLYMYINSYHNERSGLEAIIKSVLFQVNRKLQVYLQRPASSAKKLEWHPAAICVTEMESERDNAFRLMNWISDKYGFGTYIKFIKGYFSKSTNKEAKVVLNELRNQAINKNSKVYVDTIVSPSYTSAIAQVIQIPGISGMENNIILFEFDKKDPSNLQQIVDNYNLVRSGNYDVLILGASNKGVNYNEGIHIWLQELDIDNTNLMVFLSYIILSHKDWKKGKIKIYLLTEKGKEGVVLQKARELIRKGRLAITEKNLKIISKTDDTSVKTLVNRHSSQAGLTMIGFVADHINHDGPRMVEGFNEVGDILFVNSFRKIEIN